MLTLFFKNGISIKITPDKYESIEKHKTLNDECCKTCKYCLHGDCNMLFYRNVVTDFVCDFYERKRSGAYRRKRARENKNNANNKIH